MDWQEPVALAIVAVAVLLMFWGRRRRQGGCGNTDGACGCSKAGKQPRLR